jgi:hypothetical protein
MDIPKRLKDLLQREFSWHDKLVLSVLTAFAFAFTFFFYGFMDIYAANHAEIPLEFVAVLLVALGVFGAVWLLISGILFAFPGKLFVAALSLTLGLLLAGYLQGTFLNINLGELTGDAIPWEAYRRHALVNSAVWFVVLSIPFIVRYFSAAVWRKATIIVCILLCGMQSVALISTLMTSKALEPKSLNAFLSVQGEFELSSQNNILIFILDRLDYNYIDAVRQDDPSFFDRLDGFTDFTNTTALYCRTYPSATYMATGIKGFFDKPSKEHFSEAWSASPFIPQLRANNYTTKYHIEYGYVFNDTSQLVGVADNLKFGKSKPQWSKRTKNFIKLAVYRYAPHCLKATFWIPYMDFSEEVDFADASPEDELIQNNDPLFYERFLQNGLTVQNEKNN